MKVTGLFKAAAAQRQITEKFAVQNFYLDIDVDSEYPSVGEFQINNGRVDISHLKPGDPVTVHFNISGRKWEKEGRSGFAQNLVCWKIETETKATPQQTATDEPAPIEGSGDLPF